MRMIYKVTVISGENKIGFGFNSFNDMTDFLHILLETADGFETGETQIHVGRENEDPTEK